MSRNSQSAACGFLDRLRRESPLVAVELRPPQSDLARLETIDAWIDLHQALSALSWRDTALLLTDNAIGDADAVGKPEACVYLPPRGW